MRTLVAAVFLGLLSPAIAGGGGKIVRPPDRSILPAGEISIAATGPGARLELDGQLLSAHEPFPDVFHAKVTPAPGEHSLALVWEDGRREIRFFVGEGAPEGFAPFRLHPPFAIDCQTCHALSRRGRFRFKGDCFACHNKTTFVDSHQHAPHVLQDCGLCHNAHGSTVAHHLVVSRDTACKLCHN
ncbi:MAG: hypothetical protein OXH11_05620 [Candidatus Aminicenantes bacterium]|nr:hypothetical protein [Candidatus Aminicenantes bacterium]